jgi:hypothetical protein
MTTDMASEYLTLVKEEQDSLVDQCYGVMMDNGLIVFLPALVRFICVIFSNTFLPQ